MKCTMLLLIGGLIAFEAILLVIFNNLGIDKNTIAVCLTILAAIFGYFITHYLEIVRKQREQKLALYLELTKGLRLFLNEGNVLGTDSHQDLVDRFQDIYFPFALLSSVDVSKKLKAMIVQFIRFLNEPKALEEFTVAQRNLINALRNEFDLKAIEFETFDIRVEVDTADERPA